MSTPRHDCKTDDRKRAIDRPCSACSDGDSEMKYHDHCPPFREGVAAPLEPLDIETFKLNGATSREWAYLHRTRRDGTSGNLGKLLRDFAEAYAAAVSKNLQEERDRLKAELDLVDEALTRRPALAHIEHRYNKIFAACAGAAKANLLEKELAVLREKLMD